MPKYTPEEFLREQWVEYGIGMFVFALRFYARWKAVGVSNFSWDDFFAGLSVVFYTLDPIMLQYILKHGCISFMTKDNVTQLSASAIASLKKGSKISFAGWLIYVTFLWSLKGQVLGYYNRLTAGTALHKWVKVMVVVCVLSWLALVLLIFCRCTPTQRNWQIVPYPGDQCTEVAKPIITTVVLNISNDIGLILIPANVLWLAKISLRRKLFIALLLSSSFFIITCALLRGILGLRPDISGMVWGSREAFISVIVVCIPPIVPLFSKPKVGYPYGYHTSLGGQRQSSNGQKSIPLREIDPERYGTSAKDVDERSFGSRKELIANGEGSKASADVDYNKGVNVITDIAISNSKPLPRSRNSC